MRLLLVEDDEVLCEKLRDQLKRAGYAVDSADNGIDAQHLGLEEDYDVIVLDLGLPDLPGLEILRSWRAAGRNMPVLILTARDQWYDRVDGFKAGADDYVGKPFHFEELAERLKALLRRRHATVSSALQFGPFVLDEDRQALRNEPTGKVDNLTGIEFRLLRYFLLHPGVILSKSRLTEHIYAYDEDRDSNVIEVYVKRLRQKIGKDYIVTHRGQGYRFEAFDEDST